MTEKVRTIVENQAVSLVKRCGVGYESAGGLE
jgi:hypothetical protein